MDSDEPPPSLPWQMNPTTGMVIGLTFLLLCLVGPVALLVPLIAWFVMREKRRAEPDAAIEGEPPQPSSVPGRRPRRRSNPRR